MILSAANRLQLLALVLSLSATACVGEQESSTEEGATSEALSSTTSPEPLPLVVTAKPTTPATLPPDPMRSGSPEPGIELIGSGSSTTRFASIPENCDPGVLITIDTETARAGEPFLVTVEAVGEFGLAGLWWFGDGANEVLDHAFIYGVPDGSRYAWATWEVTLDEPGRYEIGSQARDLAYPRPEDGLSHQASEGCGLDYTQVMVVKHQ